MTPQQFVAKWSDAKLSERAAYQAHFNDLCELFGHPKPTDMGANDDEFCFEKRAARTGKEAKGWADVWKRDSFAWEYKSADKDLEAAYRQLQQYHDDLGSVPVLVVCDLRTIIVRVKRTNRVTVRRTILLESLAEFPSSNFEYLKRAFLDPNGLESGEEIELVTQDAASRLGEVVDSLKKRYPGETQRIARFLDRVVFGFFAEDAGLLPKDVLKRVLEAGRHDPARVSRQIVDLFDKMRTGTDFGTDEIRHFNGSLFDDLGEPLALTGPECHILLEAAGKKWDEIDPSIFGTLFERALTSDERAKLGAHYTSREDIEALVTPVILEPLRAEWEATKAAMEAAIEVEAGLAPSSPLSAATESGTPAVERGEEGASPALPNASLAGARAILEAWMARLEGIRVLDPACGSGNFLYVALEHLLGLEMRARLWARDVWDEEWQGRIRPEHFLGLELNPYAHDLAHIVVWIGFLQWQKHNGYAYPADPILRHTNNIQLGDALLDVQAGLETASERQWPAAEFIIGNPPFIAGSALWSELGREQQEALWRVYQGRVPGGADLVCYWFEKARAQIAAGCCKRAGLVATQAIRGGVNREVLKRIGASGAIFFAVSDKDWQKGRIKQVRAKNQALRKVAAVHVSLVGFDDGTQQARTLDGQSVAAIFPNLTANLDVTAAKPLAENAGICWRGTQKSGDFELPERDALAWLNQPNPHSRPNSDVLRPWRNGSALVQRPDAQWIIDTGTRMTRADLELYEKPFERVDAVVRPARATNNRPFRRDNWWLHAETAPQMRAGIKLLTRYLATPRVSKHRLFIWLTPEILCDDGIYTFARSDDYFFGVLQSRVHELWALKTGTRLEDRPRYTPTTCFDPFPFPDATDAQQAAISLAAATLNERRENWLNPPEWMREETIEFRASLDGPWGHRVQYPDARGIGTATWTRLALKPELGLGATFKQEKTLTNLYNTRPAWLQSAHAALDAAVLGAYGLASDADDPTVLAHLLDLNVSRSQ